MHALIARLSRLFWPFLGILMLVALSSCSGTTATSAPPLVWTSYQGYAFTLQYLSNWDVATKDLYLGTHYPQLEMLNGMAFSKQAPTTSLQVTYATRTSNTASARDIMLKFLLGSSSHPMPTSNLSTTMLDGASWYQGSIEKQISLDDGSKVAVKETVLGVEHILNARSTEIYLIIYQDAVSTYDQTARDFFQRMIASFHFVASTASIDLAF